MSVSSLADVIGYAQTVASAAGPDALDQLDDAAEVYERAIETGKPRELALLAALGSLRSTRGKVKALRAVHVPYAARATVRAIAALGNLSEAVLTGPSRHEQIMRYRRLGYYILHRLGYSYPEVSAALGRADHTAALHGVRVFERDLPGDPEMQRLVQQLVGHLDGGRGQERAA